MQTTDEASRRAREWWARKKAEGYHPPRRPRVPKPEVVEPFEVPAWCPETLRDDFIKIGAALGEEYAASVVRRMKASPNE
jgi:hypothetical protein